MKGSKESEKTEGETTFSSPSVPPARGFGDFTVAAPRPLPILLLADTSGSMASGGKIEALNQAITDMLTTFGEVDEAAAQINAAVIAFGQERATLAIPFAPAKEITWESLNARGRTPLGSALELARTLLEDTSTLPRRAYRPTLVLISDGIPTDDWEPALEALMASERASKAMRFAMALGDDADTAVLETFLGEDAPPVFAAYQARQIQAFFQWVTMSVTTRLYSVDPNEVSYLAPPPSLEDDF